MYILDIEVSEFNLIRNQRGNKIANPFFIKIQPIILPHKVDLHFFGV